MARTPETPDDSFRPAQLIGALALLALLVGCLLVVRPFLSALLWAAILSYSTWPAYRLLRERLGLSANLAAAIMVCAMFLVLGLPLLFAAPTSGADVENLRQMVRRATDGGLPSLSGLVGSIPVLGPWLQGYVERLGMDLSGLFQTLQPYIGSVAQLLLSGLLGILSGLAELLIAILLAFFFFRDGARLADAVQRMAERIAGARGRHLVLLAGDVTQGVVYGLLGTAVAQGVMTGFGLWLVGVPQPVLLGVVAGCISILPVGAPVVWIPAAIWLFIDGRGWAGAFMLVYGAGGISSVDNFIRPWLIARGADLPLLLTILGALGGAFAFGLLGLFLGPVLLAVGFTILKEWLDQPPVAGVDQGGSP
ncbi:AI-2E family transporter [Roseomonas gilardii subsp. gilardii]|uniref:AI-2E family transporter n=1 Tax=Roseomonas gilardii TaxID=257708 RepID=UPI001FF8B930|nr:AI-2E family transporter [Roseomonas gilardii]UPG71603.1 AI-2E family transporter [Roseomonas gilardii subsp. gilardii]